MVSRHLEIPEDAIAGFCRRWEIKELAVFGSALRADFRSDSDVDVLVTFAAGARWTLFDMVHMREDLEKILGRRVDLVSRRGVERSRNPLRRQAILSSAEPIYVQR
jgi:hypothetical protein